MAAEATASTELVTMAEITPSALMETTMVNTEDYNTLIECLKSDIPLTTTLTPLSTRLVIRLSTLKRLR